MRIYHGTNVDFDTIELSKSLPYKDFGRGFYLRACLVTMNNKMNMILLYNKHAESVQRVQPGVSVA